MIALPYDDEFSWVEHWLALWAADMRKPAEDLGYPNRSLALTTDSGGYTDINESWGAEGDFLAIQIINTLLGDVPIAEAAAIRHVQLGCAYLQAEPMIENYLSGRMTAGIRLRKEGYS